MTPQRTCRYQPLRQQPLTLVLGQVRFSRVRQMNEYVARIQERFRRSGFPIERAEKVQQFSIAPAGVRVTEEERWQYRTKDQRWSILLSQDGVVLQTTAYERFEDFAERLELAVQTVLEATELNTLGLVERVGLRYINLIAPTGDETHRDYLRQGLHGADEAVFREGTARLFIEQVGRTDVDGEEGAMVIRVTQNDLGFDLPPDLVDSAPDREARAMRGELVTLLDTDHFIEGSFEADAAWVVGRTYTMHDVIIETFHDRLVTEYAIKVWQ